MKILALDLGTLTGWATFTPKARPVIRSGVWNLADPEPGRRILALRRLLRAELPGVELLAFEDVPAQAHSGGDAAHLWGAWWGELMATCSERRLRFLGVAPATWKRAADLGAGTDAIDALRAAQARWPGVRFATPDEAVARWVAVAAAGRMA